jgi:hypothetical protein
MEVFATEMYTIKSKSEGALLLTLIQRMTLDILISNATQIKDL